MFIFTWLIDKSSALNLYFIEAMSIHFSILLLHDRNVVTVTLRKQSVAKVLVKLPLLSKAR